jgi:hypothetical protein
MIIPFKWPQNLMCNFSPCRECDTPSGLYKKKTQCIIFIHTRREMALKKSVSFQYSAKIINFL